MSAFRPTKLCRFSYVLLAILLFVIIIAVFIHCRISSHISDLCRYKCAETANRMISDIVTACSDTDSKYYIIKYDNSGKIVSASANDHALNELQNKLRSGLNDKLSGNLYEDVTIALGDLTDIELLNGKGFDLSFGFQFSGKADTRIISSFEPAGINQTRFKASVMITAEFLTFFNGKSEKITVEQEYIAADALIVGEVPGIYASDSIGT